MRRFFFPLLAFLVFATAAPAFALDLGAAKAQGVVGERPDGLVGIVSPPGAPEVQALVRDVNDGRMAAYGDIAARQGSPIEAVKALAGRSLVEKTPQGQYVLSPSGQWIKK